VERGETLLVHLVHVGAALDQLIYHHVLAVVARHVKGGVTVPIGLIYLEGEEGGEWVER
jgi:hypothetical protein